MENRNNVLLTVIGLATLLVVLVGASFAYFTATASDTANSVETGKLAITSTLSGTHSDVIKPTVFSLTNTTYKGKEILAADNNTDIGKFEFNVKGTGTTVTGATYEIRLLGALATVPAEGQEAGEVSGDTAAVKYKLYNESGMVAEGQFDQADGSAIKTNLSLTGATDDTYTLYVYIEESGAPQDNLQNITISATMHAYAQTPAPTAAGE